MAYPSLYRSLVTLLGSWCGWIEDDPYDYGRSTDWPFVRRVTFRRSTGFLRLSQPVSSTRAASWTDPSPEDIERPTKWAQPMELDGVPNLFKVTGDLYRSGQPTAHGLQQLKRIGIETIVNLRSLHSDRDKVGDTGLACEHIALAARHPQIDAVVRFLQIATNRRRVPVLIHCHHGANRTGAVCAAYRIAVQGWSKEDALSEMTGGAFGYSPAWVNLVQWLETLDFQPILSRVGLVADWVSDADCWP